MTAKPAMTAEAVERAFAEAGKVDTRYCKIGRVIHEHEHGKLIAEKVGAAHLFSAELISRVLKSFDISVSGDIITRHRRGVCRCPKED